MVGGVDKRFRVIITENIIVQMRKIRAFFTLVTYLKVPFFLIEYFYEIEIESF